MSESLILSKLERMEEKMDKIETTVQLIAVQEERINNLSGQINSLWLKYDTAFGSNGVITEVKNWQASCPRDTIRETLTVQWTVMKNAISQQWIVIGLLSSVICGVVLKLLGVLK